MPTNAPAPKREPPLGPPTIYIGPKPTMTYVFQVAAQLNSGADPVLIKARGNAIAKAVDVAEVVQRRLLKDQTEVGEILIDTERLVNRDGREANVSSITIPMRRKAGAWGPAVPPAPSA